jgi:TonB-linked SusC/RagA family outer membrane protein
MESSARNSIGVSAKRPTGVTGPSSILQKVEVTGKVTDAETGQGIPGINILIKGTQNAVSTDFDGNYQIRIDSKNAVLVFSFIGYDTSEVVVGNRTSINIALRVSNTKLTEVVVVGYGKQKKINSTGATSSISTKALVQSPVANISNSLAGRVTGVFAVQGGGEPGNDASRIRIRGAGTFSGNTDPLVLVDGIQVDNYNNIDPNEIDTITILKDASSTAVYGIRGANGVMIITTKRGKTGPPKVSYTFNIASNSFTTMREQMNSADYATNFNRGLLNDTYVNGQTYTPRYTDAEIELYRNGSDPIFYPDVDWTKEIFRDYALQTQHNFNISGGSLKTKYFVSAGYFTQEGQFREVTEVTDAFSPQSVYKRYNIRSNFNFELTDRLKMTLDLSSQTETRSGNNNSDGTNRVIGDVFRASPLSTPGIVDGKIVNISTASVNNPYVSLLYPQNAGGLRRSYRNFLNGSIRFDYDLGYITKGLSTQANVAVQTYNTQNITNSKILVTYVAFKQPDGSVGYAPQANSAQFQFSESGDYNRRVTAEWGIDYKKSYGKHNLTGLLLYNQQKTFNPTRTDGQTVPNREIPKGYQSYVGRVTYNYDGRYLAEVNIGYNGTENFAEGKRFGSFPAYSLGWIASQESFFPQDAFVSFLKIRGSYGLVGNDDIGNSRFIYRPTSYANYNGAYYLGDASLGNYAAQGGTREGTTGNPNVTWETSLKRNIGFEMNVFKDKIKLVADVFDELRDDILATPQTISNISGLSQPATNLGKMENKGYELELSYNDRIGDVGFNISGNYSFARNKILFRDEIEPQDEYQRRTGQSLNQFFGLVADGLYNTWDEVNDPNRPVYQWSTDKIQPGDIRYVDQNGDGKINDFDSRPIGYTNLPEAIFGLTLGANYKGFDLSILFQGAGNVSHYYSDFQGNTGFGGNPLAGSAAYFNESWTQERYDQGLPINFPRYSLTDNPNRGAGASSFYLADASYVRLKNVEVGYNFQGRLLEKIGISSCRLYVNANNLYTWDKMLPGIDPENTSTGNTNTEPYPLVRTINSGLNVNF